MWDTRQRADLGGLSAIVSGTGPPMLLIHGVGLRAEAWAGQIDALSSEFTTIAVDLLGHGGSALPDRDLSLADYTNAFAATLDSPTVVVGHSMGAMIALDLAIRFPERVRGVAALNAIHQRSAMARAAVVARAARLDGVGRADPTETLDRWFGSAPSQARDAARTWLGEVNPAGYAMAYRVFADEDGADPQDLKMLTCPALYLTGSDEPNSTPAMSHRMADLTPMGRSIIIDGAAHMMPMTHVDLVNAALLDFARACSP